MLFLMGMVLLGGISRPVGFLIGLVFWIFFLMNLIEGILIVDVGGNVFFIGVGIGFLKWGSNMMLLMDLLIGFILMMEFYVDFFKVIVGNINEI